MCPKFDKRCQFWISGLIYHRCPRSLFSSVFWPSGLGSHGKKGSWVSGLRSWVPLYGPWVSGHGFRLGLKGSHPYDGSWSQVLGPIESLGSQVPLFRYARISMGFQESLISLVIYFKKQPSVFKEIFQERFSLGHN